MTAQAKEPAHFAIPPRDPGQYARLHRSSGEEECLAYPARLEAPQWPFGFQDRLDYRIIVNWVIAEHKSQGIMQLYLNSFDTERSFFFAIDDDAGVARAKALFARLSDRSLKPGS